MVSARWLMRFAIQNGGETMFGKKARWIAPLAASAVVLLAASPASAAPGDIIRIDLPASESCTDFDIALTYNEATIRERKFDNGTVYQVGTGRIITWSNEGLDGEGSNGKTYTVKTSGSVSRFVPNADGSTLTFTGHNAFVYFSTDKTGPGAYQYTGRVVLQLDSNLAVTSVDATAGKAVDVCALLR
jgi:hypothetical protein